MAADQVSYQRARNAALIGLALQTAFGVVLTLYWLFADNDVVRPSAFATLLGIPVWVALIIVFNQHVREQREAAEAESFRVSEAAAASVFEDAGADMVVEANRLRWMHRYLLPAVSIALGAAYLLIGLFIYRGATAEDARFDAPGALGVGVAIGAMGGIACFIFARYTAGMAKEKSWILLNGGAAAAVGMTLQGVLIALSHFLLEAVESSRLIELVPTIVAIYMMALGGEMFLNFILNLYRPRAAGEYLRPAFDSRILAYIAAPDRLAQSVSEAINYQFGFRVSSTWFYRLLSKWVLRLVAVTVIVGWLMTSLVVVAPNERGLLLDNGVNDGVVEPGLVIKKPWPVSRVVRFPATALNRLSVGSEPDLAQTPGALLWSQDDVPGELMFIVQPSQGRPDDDAGAGQSLAVAPVVVSVTYSISDVERYFNLAQDGPESDRDRERRRLLRSVAGSVATAFFATVPFDEVVTGLSDQLIADLQARLQARLNAPGLSAGVLVQSVGVIGASPAKQVADALEGAVASEQARTSAVQRARAEADRLLTQTSGNAAAARQLVRDIEAHDRLEQRVLELIDSGAPQAEIRAARERADAAEARLTLAITEAGGFASERIVEARGERWETVFEARAEAARYVGRSEVFQSAPEAYKTNYLLEAIRRAARDVRVWIVPDDVNYRLEQIEVTPSIDIGPAPGSEE
jgi:regulator of protease activity HflC (stomatin/prohibitin superfamily)